MAITNEKTWQFGTGGDPDAHVNYNGNDPANLLATARKSLLFIKNSLKAVSSGAWTVVGSCDSVSYAMDGTDYWDSATDLVWSVSGAKSWIVLKQTGITSNFQLLLWLDNATSTYYGQLTAYYSLSAGFTGGDTTNRPTATDERLMGTRINWLSTATTGNCTPIWHVMVSTDGQCTRVVQCMANYAVGLWLFDKPKNPEAGWTNPHAASIASDNAASPTANYLTYANYCDVVAPIRSIVGGIARSFYCGTIGFGANPMGQQIAGQNSQLSEWEAYPIWLCHITEGAKGTKGQLFDMWWDTDNAGVVTGDYLTQASVITHAVFKDFILPFYNVIPTVT